MMQPALVGSRDAALDLLKWLAMLSMFVDHLRFVWPELAWAFVPGRLAFPFFCLAVAANVRRGVLSWRYLAWLLMFALLSEWPYRLLVGNSTTLNILPTLALGLLIAQGVAHDQARVRGLALLALGVAWWGQQHLMFGFFGALLPTACLLALSRRGGWYLLAGMCAVLANYSPTLWAGARQFQAFAWVGVMVCGVAPLLGLSLLRGGLELRIWPLRRWGYLLYPGHLLIWALVREQVAR